MRECEMVWSHPKMASVSSKSSLQLQLQICSSSNKNYKRYTLQNFKTSDGLCVLSGNLSSISMQRYSWSTNFPKRINRRVHTRPCKNRQLRCHCFINTGPSLDASCVKNATLTFVRSFNRLQGNPVFIKLASAVGIVIFALWGLGPLVRQSRNIFLRENDSSWKKSSTYLVTTSYLQPLLLWIGAIFICRALDPMILPTQAGEIVKKRLLNFVRSLSAVLAFAYCFSSLIQQAQKFFMETNDPSNTRNMGFQFAGKAVYTAVWVAAVSLFMELLGFSTQRWLTAGGLGTVLLTLAGREIFINFLSSAMIHATRPFVVNEWIQTKIQGYDVSGTVEHVGWWSPTIIRGDDREAVHIPNHKFTVNVVRNLTQKTHWRIKTHLAISHLDVSKINNIVADMRKVLAKNPQVEQQKLHRRVFLDNINPENQALLILVSCFVKTSHFEEYLCVKEAILMDMLRVIRHHRARLATPIRTVQKMYGTDAADLDNVPFSDSIFNDGTTSNRPMLLIEPSDKTSREDHHKNKTQAPPLHVNRELDDSKIATASKSSPNGKVEVKLPETTVASSTGHETKDQLTSDAQSDNTDVQQIEKKDPKLAAAAAVSSDHKLNNNTKPGSKTETKAVEETISSSDPSSRPEHNTPNNKKPQKAKQEDARQSVAQPPASKPSLEENIVLGVALEGSKRTLPIEEDMPVVSSAEDVKEFATMRGGNNDKSNTKRPKNHDTSQQPVDQSDHQD